MYFVDGKVQATTFVLKTCRQEMLNDCINKSIDDADDLEPNKDKININIFLSSDVQDGDGFSDVEAHAPRADIKHVVSLNN